MELDDLRKQWEAADAQQHKKNRLTPDVVNEMTQRKFQSMLRRIEIPELIGGTICIVALGFIALNFGELNTVFLQGAGVAAVLLLAIIPMLSFLSLNGFDVDIDKPYIATLKHFARRKLRFLKYQKANVLLSYMLLVTVIILLPKFFFSTDVNENRLFWIFAFPAGYVFLIFYSRWVNKMYGSILREAEELLSELEA